MSMKTPKSAGTFCFSQGHLNQYYSLDLFSVSQNIHKSDIHVIKACKKEFKSSIRWHIATSLSGNNKKMLSTSLLSIAMTWV